MFCSDKYHGVILIPEGLIESIPEVYALLKVSLLPKQYAPSRLQNNMKLLNIRVFMDLYVSKSHLRLLKLSGNLSLIWPCLDKQLN